jgi:FeS assembly SUF system regulator
MPMFRLNKLTDYAVVILSHMARHNTQHSTSMLASETAVNEPTVAKVLKDLVKAGVVTSARGATGGYTLSGTPETITVRQIIEAIEGPIALADCVEGHATGCAVQVCGTRGNWDQVNAAIVTALNNVKLTDMMHAPEKVQEKTKPQLVQIA